MSLWSMLRDARYALPGVVGPWLPEPDAARLAAVLREKGWARVSAISTGRMKRPRPFWPPISRWPGWCRMRFWR
jgi:hypothetical protein